FVKRGGPLPMGEGTAASRPDAQPALVIALSDRHAACAQDVVGGDGVEIEIGDRVGEEEGLRGERQGPGGPGRSGGAFLVNRTEYGKVQVPAGPAIDLFGGECLERR